MMFDILYWHARNVEKTKEKPTIKAKAIDRKQMKIMTIKFRFQSVLQRELPMLD